ncbi:hypothetical protein [Halobaculum lipolyticum]|uniref:Uncharacterized protein n=1 Tax=Halobaculum lipolyticum TaxID=3032001 RepID=A0ABD5WHP6_9EURY|nr:hypothetical protein [Halobaculum sp. DT31]
MSRPRLLAGVRAAVVAVGLAGHVAVAAFVFDLPPPPETGDGVPAGFAFAFALLGTAAAGVLTTVAYGLPSGEGRLRFGPLADRSCTYRLVAGGGAAGVVGLSLTIGLAMLLSGRPATVVWVLGVGLLVGGLVALALGGVAVAVRLGVDGVRERLGTRS